jgi:hypothetical protein
MGWKGTMQSFDGSAFANSSGTFTPTPNLFSMGYQRSQLLEDTRYDLIGENTDELSLTCPPVKALGLIREDGPFDGQSLRNPNLKRVTFDLGGDGAKDRKPNLAIVCCG